jgi:hypothetical protein
MERRGMQETADAVGVKQRVQAHEKVLSAEHCQQLVAKLSDLAGDALGAQADVEMSVPVPISLYGAIMSALRPGSVSLVATGALAVENMESGSGMVMMPAKISGKAVPLHKDRYGGKCGDLVEGFSAVLYLSDGGAISFVDASSKRRVRDVSVVQGRLVVWDNVSLLHEVGPAEASAPRFMLVPMSVNPMGDLVAVGGGGGGCGGGGGGGGRGIPWSQLKTWQKAGVVVFFGIIIGVIIWAASNGAFNDTFSDSSSSGE